MELTNLLMKYRGTPAAETDGYREATDLLLLMLAPEAPHIAEELSSRRLAAGGEAWRSIHTEPWPTHDESLVAAEMIELPVQINGKVRDRIQVPASISEDDAIKLALESEGAVRHMDGKQPRKVIYISQRGMVNIVV